MYGSTHIIALEMVSEYKFFFFNTSTVNNFRNKFKMCSFSYQKKYLSVSLEFFSMFI